MGKEPQDVCWDPVSNFESTDAQKAENTDAGDPIDFKDVFFNPRASVAIAAKLDADQLVKDSGELKRGESGYGSESAKPFEFILMGICGAVPAGLLIAFFSDVGSGIRTYCVLATMSMIGNALVSLGFLLFFIFYILDWSGFEKRVKTFTAVLVCYILFASAFLKAKTHPQGSVIVLMFHPPILLGLLRVTVSKSTYKYHFYNGIAFVCSLCAFCSLVLWIVWLFGALTDHDNMWNHETKARMIAKSNDLYKEWDLVHERDCGLNKVMNDPETGQQYEKEYLLKRAKACAAVKTTWYLVWICPMISSGVNMIIALFCYLRGRYLANSENGGKTEGAVKLTMIFFAMLLMGMWIAASIAGASMRLAGTLMGFVAGGMLAMFIWLYLELGHANLLAASQRSNLVRSIVKFAMSDWARAIFICFANIFIAIAMFINMVNQCVRRMRGQPSTGSVFTKNFALQIENMKSWNWASILSKVNLLCILYFVLMIGVAKVTYIFLSWLNEQLQSVDAGLVIIIFFCIGYLMFMLPPVPGVPVYITGGIILSARMASTSIGFWGGTCIALATGYCLKLTAVAGQWSIGKLMGKSVKIQKMVGVDSVGIRAIEDILKVERVSFAKVAILVGGPDWPTSVLCGILNLKCWKCVVGTMLCIFIAAPCVLVGAFLLKAGEEAVSGKGGTWGAVAGTTLFVATLGQSGAMMIAAYYMSEVMQEKGEELAKPRPEHKPIEDLTKAEAHFVATYGEVTKWDSMPCHSKVLLSVATLCMLGSTCVLVLCDVQCFRPFSLTSRIDDPIHEGGLGGDVLDIVLPLGRLACLMFFFACLLYKCWTSWATSETKKRVANGVQAVDPEK